MRHQRAAAAVGAGRVSALYYIAFSGGDEPAWINVYHHARLSADAAEIFRDLKNPKAALTWNQQAVAMPSGVFTPSVGMRLAIVGTAHLQARDLDHGLELGNRSIDNPRPSPVHSGQVLRRRVQRRPRPLAPGAGRPRLHPPHPHKTRHRSPTGCHVTPWPLRACCWTRISARKHR
ncbi:sporulation associated protein [Streptomyces albus]|uniref:Sporulation associated protein n=1 Tax=Streptomyces albus (strain ATCC 21838 / DSM 41398 / FERM P-419 / JCM 4703 / NBRC 107858) TaxID=1081613 RepID=A0A0B5F949_STRA4|nr:sporulation associated protein [Streptomyces albus]AOU81653.1 sporulation associated protein [Streptomyces albus]AYN37344.1 sporulation associated protein [Streptomyces albus]